KEMKYFVDSPKTDDKNSSLDSVKYKSLNVEELKIIEPCCGSGHILVYAFDLLYKMYVEKGYNSKDIPGLILKNNLFGLDVDKRAAQLAQFSLLMKARSIDNRFFNHEREVVPHVFEITDSTCLIEDDYLNNLRSFKFSEESLQMAEYLVTSFRDGKTIGSLLKIRKLNYLNLITEIDEKEKNEIPNVLQQHFWNYGLVELKNLATIAAVLSSKYDVMITNPPYIGIATMEKPVREYALKYYPNSKTDMFAMFMETDLVKKNGFLAMINMHSWMFLSSFEKLRRIILDKSEIVVMAHLGARAFETISGEVVQTTSFVLRNCRYDGQGIYFRLVDSSNKEKDFLEALTNNE
ncbi:MAG: Eco57I restriction-modification methylase domain-containing protein, partial [Bacilli bacterium]|nr:Eco57I restriction-modification methylase domain-containing protein [Bacilli bacterium]